MSPCAALSTSHNACVCSRQMLRLMRTTPAASYLTACLGGHCQALLRYQRTGHEPRGNVVIPQRGDCSVEIPDFVHVLAKFRSGAEASLQFSGVAAHAPGDKLWIYGSEGTLSYDFTTEELALGRRGGSMEIQPIPAELERTWTVERDFIAAVRDPAAPRPSPTFIEGLCYMRVVEAVWRAMEEGDSVEVR
jgi:predicted dehydrogenase